MKTFKKIFILLSVFLTGSLFAQDSVTVSFHSGFPLYGTNAGIKMGSFVPYVGLDVVRLSLSYNNEWDYWQRDYSSNILYKYSEYREIDDASTFLLIPQIGFRYYFSENELKTYFKSDIMKIFPFVSGKEKRTETYYNVDGTIQSVYKSDNRFTDEKIEEIEDTIDYWGISFGFGIEYKFSDHFSVGGEYGFRYFGNSITKKESDSSENNGQISWKYKWEEEITNTLSMTYTSFTLNYYFN